MSASTTTTARIVLSLDPGNLPAASKQAAASIERIGTAGTASARQTAAAMRTLPAQFTDIATQLQGGANPFTVLLQQGGQIRDQFGSIGAALRGIGSVLSPAAVGFGALAGGVGVFVAAAVKGYNEANQLRDTLALTGNAAGLTADGLVRLGAQISSLTGQTVGETRAAVLALAETGRVPGEVLESTAVAVARIADLTGKSGAQLAQRFAAQFKDPARYARELNEQYNFLDEAQARRIVKLQAEGKFAEAVNATNQALVRQFSVQRQELGALERLWDGAGKAASEYWRKALNLGKPATLGDQLASVAADMQSAERQLAANRERGVGDFGVSGVAPVNRQLEARIAARRSELLALSRRQDAENVNAQAAAARAAASGKVNDILTPPKTGAAAPKADPLGGIRDARQQYQQDFLRSEKAFYGELEKLDAEAVELAKKDAEARDRALKEDARRAAERLASETTYLQGLVDANARAGAELLGDERARGLALIELDRSVALRRLDEMQLTIDARRQALDEINRSADLAGERLQRDLERGADLAGDLGLSFTSAFEDAIVGGNGLRGVLQGLSQDVLRIIARRTIVEPLGAGITDLLKGIGGGGGVGLLSAFGDLFGSFSGFFAEGGRIPAGHWGVAGERGPERIFGPATVVPMSGAPQAGGGLTVNVAAGVTRGEVVSAIQVAMQATEGRLMRRLQLQRVV